MATYSETFSGSSAYSAKLTVSQSSQSVANNTSTVAWSLVVTKNSGSGYWTNNSQSYSVSINGSTVRSGTWTYDFRSSSSKTIASGTVAVSHNSDGSKTVAASASVSMQSPIGSSTPSGQLTLKTIARASAPTLSASSVDAGSSVTISTNRASSSFTHTLTYTFGSASGTIATGVGTSTSWTVPLTVLNQIPSATSGKATITCKTYSGGTLVGSKSTSLTVKAGTSIRPAVTGITCKEAVAAVSTVTGVAAGSAASVYVQGQSKLAWTMTGVAGAYGSTIKTYTLTVAGQTRSGASGTTGVITQSGSKTVTATVTDSRGRSATYSTTISVLAWSAPTITSSQARRATSSGSVSQTGTYIRVDANASVSSLTVSSAQKNTLTYKTFIRQKGSTSWGTAKSNVTASGISINTNWSMGTYVVTSTWEVQLVISDKFASTTKTFSVSTDAVTMHWGKNAVGIGKRHEQGILDVGGDIYQNGQKVIDASVAATSSAKGVVELATNAETQAGTDSTRAVTPASLAATTATDSRAGVAALATQAEVDSNASGGLIVTPARLRNAAYAPFAMASGSVSITPDANTPTGASVTFPSGRFTQTPNIMTTPNSAVPGTTVLGTAFSNPSTSGCTIWVTRTNNTETTVYWIAVQMRSGAANG